MYENIIGSRAEKVGDNSVVSSEEYIENFSFTPYVQMEELEELISMKLDKAEKELDLHIKDLNDLKELVSIAPPTFTEKDVYESRLKSLFNLYFISKELNLLIPLEQISNDEPMQKVIEIDALLQVSNHGPLRNLLEEKINKIKSVLKLEPKELINTENMVTFINNAQSPEQINEILCEVFIEEYVNLGSKGREIVAMQFWEQSSGYQSKVEILRKLNELISNFIKNPKNLILSQVNEVSGQSNNKEEVYKNTLEFNELARIIE